MFYIINGTNSFSKDATISALLDKLGSSYNIQHVNISSTTKPEVAQQQLEDLSINLSMDGLYSSEFCGVVSLPEPPKKKKSSKSKKNIDTCNTLFTDLVTLASTYCSEAKQLILHLPIILSPSEKKEVTTICNNMPVEFIDLKYISTYKEIYQFCIETLENTSVNFATKKDQDLFIEYICNFSECTTNSKGQLEDLTIFSKPNSIVYNQQLIYSTITSLFLWSLNKKGPITFEDTKPLLLSSQPKQHIYASVERIMKCATKEEVFHTINSVFEPLSKQEILSVLTTLKFCLWDYLKFINNNTQSRYCKIITNGNLKIKNPLALYNSINYLREDPTLHIDSYKNDLILFLWEQFD